MGIGSTLLEGVRVALDSLRGNKVRSALTILGVTIGVMVVMVMAAMVQGLNSSFQDAIASAGPNTFYVVHASFAGGGVSGPLDEEESEFMKNPPLDPDWARELGRLPGIRRASAGVDLSGMPFMAEQSGQDVRISLYGVDAGYLEIDAGDVTDGRFFTANEEQRNQPVAVIDSQTALDLFEGRDPLSKNMKIGSPGSPRAPFRVVGTYRRPTNLFAGFSSHWVFIPFSAAMKYLNPWDRLIWITVQPADETRLEDAVETVRGRMRQLRGLRPTEADNFDMITQDRMQDFWNRLTGVFFAAMVALSGVGLMVGGIGVIGIMMISVTERTREIGLRKAMGARRRDLLWQFLVEAATVTLVGGAVGLFLGGGLVWLVNTFTPLPASVPMWSVVAALVASGLTGIGFGLYPAAKGARLDPVEALRYE